MLAGVSARLARSAGAGSGHPARRRAHCHESTGCCDHGGGERRGPVLGKPPFDDVRNAPLSLIVSFGSHVLVCRPDFRARDAYLLAQTLAEQKTRYPQPPVPPGELSRRTEDRMPFSPAKGCPMIDDLATASPSRTGNSPLAIRKQWKTMKRICVLRDQLRDANRVSRRRSRAGACSCPARGGPCLRRCPSWTDGRFGGRRSDGARARDGRIRKALVVMEAATRAFQISSRRLDARAKGV